MLGPARVEGQGLGPRDLGRGHGAGRVVRRMLSRLLPLLLLLVLLVVLVVCRLRVVHLCIRLFCKMLHCDHVDPS